MSMEQLLEVSSHSLFIAFILLLSSLVPIGLSIKSKYLWTRKLGLLFIYAALLLQLLYFFLRWTAIHHAPVSNMYEFMTFFGIMLIASTLLLYQLYKQIVLLLFSIPVALIILGFGGVFTRDATPLIPALQSHWLSIHVITVALSSAILSVAFAAGVIYLLRVLDTERQSVQTRLLEFVMFCLISVMGFICCATLFPLFSDQTTIQFENREQQSERVDYTMPALIVNEGAISVDNNEPIGWIELPNSIDAAKTNTIFWTFLAGTIIYLLIRIITRKKIIQSVKSFTDKVSPALMDEISYRAVIVGFPLFSLGGLLFAMIWAHLAWGRFWGWDPKEVWALITWLFYAAFLHLRTSQGWDGNRTAWMSIIGFGLIVFNQVFVNLVIAGLHSYA